MKSLRKMFRGYAVALAAALLLTTTAHATANKAIVRAVRDGEAQYSKDKGQTWNKVSVGTVLQANYQIKTDANATADLFLGDNGPVVRVTKGTVLGIDRLDVDGTGIEKVIDTQLDLRNGRILGNVKKMAAASKYEVKTPVGVAGIRGTEYSISADGRVNVVSGTVVIVYIVEGVPQAPITITQGNSATPPATNGGTVVITPQTGTPDPTLVVQTTPGGAPLDDNGNPIITVVVPGPPTTTSNPTPGPTNPTENRDPILNGGPESPLNEALSPI